MLTQKQQRFVEEYALDLNATQAVRRMISCVPMPSGRRRVRHVGGQGRDARWARFVTQKAINAFFHEALLPAPDAGWIGGPCEWFGVFVGFGDEAIDGGLEIGQGSRTRTPCTPT